MRVDRVDLLQQVDLVLGQTHVGAVKAFRLEGLRQAEQALDSLLSPEGVWGRTPWVQQKTDADPPTVYV